MIPGKKILLRLGGVIAGCFLIFAVAGQANLIRADAIAAVACTGRLFGSPTDHLATIARYQPVIAAAAREKDLPPELLASIIYGHQRYISAYRHFTDCFGSALGADLSLGLAQIRLSTAAGNEGKYLESLSPAEFKAYRTELMTPESNIGHQANELRLLLERNNRYPGIDANTLIHDPAIMALVMSEYRAGRTRTPSATSRLSANAFNDMRGLLLDEIYLFNRPPGEVALIKDEVRSYLDFIYCTSGIFNAGVCDSWRQTTARPAP